MYVVAITSVFTGLAFLVVALRLYTRIYMVKAPGLDDLLMSCALISDLAFFVCIILEQKYRLGTHSTKLSEYDLQHQLFVRKEALLLANYGESKSLMKINYSGYGFRSLSTT
jgi:hypothetical protein